MLKFGTFFLGISSGIYLGIHLREQGFSAGLTRSYYAFHNLEYGKLKKKKEKTTIDELYQYYRAGLLEGEDLKKFEEMMRTKRYNKIDEIVLNDVDKLFEKDIEFKEIKNKFYSK